MEDHQRIVGVEAEASGAGNFQCEAVTDMQSIIGLVSDTVRFLTDRRYSRRCRM
jgi:hypothetical protein